MCKALLQRTLDWVSRAGPWGPAIFIALYILACILFIPGALLTLGGGAIFGVVWGSVYVSIAATVGATFAFLIGRYAAREWVQEMISHNEKFKAVDKAVAKEGWKIVGLVRLSPVFPFNVINYAFGVTQVSLRDYCLASWIGMLPGTVMYVYIGSLAGDIARLGTHGRTRNPAEWTLYFIGLGATIIVGLYVTHLSKKAISGRVAGAS